MNNTSLIITIFGASGDLAKLKLFPAIYNLFENNLFPEHFKVVGFSRKPYTNEDFRKFMEESIKSKHTGEVKQEKLDELLSHVTYFSGNYDNLDDYKKLRDFIFEGVDKKNEVCNLNYLSVPPFIFRDIIQNLAESREDKNENMRLIIEKPFGEDEESAQNLFHFVNMHFSPEQIYLLDHYLGKLAVQSLLHLRRANRILNSMIQGTEIANIQISAFEDVGVEERIGYFEDVGIIKDFVHSHLLQILALVTMNIPTTKTGASLSREKYSILSSLNYSGNKEDLVVAQYESYANHEGVKPDSKTETYAAMKLSIDLEEWYNVPIYLRVGKKLDKKATYVVIELEKYAFQEQYDVPMNRVIIKLQPDQELIVKIYNQFLDGSMHELDLKSQLLRDSQSIECVGGNTTLTEYATLIKDAINAERLFFLDFSEVLASWKIMDQVIKHKNSGAVEVYKYKDGSVGPEQADYMTNRDGFKWLPY